MTDTYDDLYFCFESIKSIYERYWSSRKTIVFLYNGLLFAFKIPSNLPKKQLRLGHLPFLMCALNHTANKKYLIVTRT